jgi:hypothetical protein
MSSSTPNRLVYVFPAIAFTAVLMYYLYGAVDRLGLEVHEADARVTGKQVAHGSTTYNTRIAAGRAWTQATDNPDAYILEFVIDGEPTGGAVDPRMYEAVNQGDSVRVEFQRSRLTKRLMITDVRRKGAS